MASSKSSDATARASRPSDAEKVEIFVLMGQVHMALRQYEGVFDSARRQISIVGPVNTGKSSLFIALLLPKQPQAEVSPIPGTTRDLQVGDAGLCTVVDTPGGDEAAGDERKKLAFESAQAVECAGDEFLAHPGFLSDEHGLRCTGDGLDVLEYGKHLFIVGDEKQSII